MGADGGCGALVTVQNELLTGYTPVYLFVAAVQAWHYVLHAAHSVSERTQGAHYDPLGAGSDKTCVAGADSLKCEVGDLSGKYGSFHGNGDSQFFASYWDR